MTVSRTAPLSRRHRRRDWTLLASAWLAAAMGSASVGRAQSPAFILPTPTGRDLVGTTRFVIDSGGTRPLVVTVWYPAARTAATVPTAPYLREEAALRTMAAWGQNAGPMLLRNTAVVTHSHLDASVARGRFPVVVFSHGYLDQPSSYTALMEELASHGYAVFSVAHTGETMAVTLSAGRVSSIFLETGGLQPIPAAVSAEWRAEDSVATAITTASTPAAAEVALRAYLRRIPTSTTALDRWVDDVGRVVDELRRRNGRQSGSPFAEHLDLAHVAAVGHSMGGVASAAFCARDARCRAAINLDGSPQYGNLIDHPSRTPLLMVYGSRPGRIGVSDVVYDRGAEYWRAVVDGALHLNFGDWQYWPADSPVAASLGSLSAGECTTIVHRVVREFLDRTLRRAPAPLYDGRASLPALTLTQRAGGRRP
jgi:predicted dienelactone hydrolase